MISFQKSGVPPNGKGCGQRPESQIILIEIKKNMLSKWNSGRPLKKTARKFRFKGRSGFSPRHFPFSGALHIWALIIFFCDKNVIFNLVVFRISLGSSS